MSEDESHLEKTIIDTTYIYPNGKQGVRIPKRIGPYKVEGLLKRGGTSLLYLGIHPDNEEIIVLKVLSPKYVSHPEMIDHFLQEAKIIEMANHPNIVKLYGHGKWEQGLYIAMEFVRGISLRKLILQNILSFKRSLEIILEAAMALSHLHSHGVVHRDLKPENILLCEEGGVKVIDFGISQLIGEETSLKTKGKLVGTPTYMSPEQKENPLSVSFPTDIYSLAIITYELCLGRLSYGVIELTQIPKGLRSILNNALKPNPNDRYESIDDYINDINHYLNSTFEDNEEILELSLKELSDLYESVSFTLKPKFIPTKSKYFIGSACPSGILSGHVYSDYLSLKEDALAIIISCSQHSGVLGMFYSSLIKGMVQGLREIFDGKGDYLVRSNHFLQQLNSLLIQNEIGSSFFNLLLLSPSTNNLYYFCCGEGSLFKVDSGTNRAISLETTNSPLGEKEQSEFLHVVHNWNIGDQLFLFSKLKKGKKEAFPYERFIESNLLSSGDKQAISILKSLAIAEKTTVNKLPMMVLNLQRKG